VRADRARRWQIAGNRLAGIAFRCSARGVHLGKRRGGRALSLRFSSGTGFLNNEWPVLCACVSPSTSLEAARQALTGTFDWDVLLEAAEEHSVQGIVAKRLEELHFENVPQEAREKLQSRMRAQHLFTLSMTAELFRVLNDFSSAGLEAIVIKGPVTSLVAYGDPALRGFGDVDLLLRQKDISAASQRMQSQGFVPSVTDSAIAAGKIPGEYVFKRPGTNRMIEIHTEQTFRYYPAGMPIEMMFRRKRMLPFDGREVPALSLTDEIVFYCVHGAKDFWERLMWICDVAAIAKNRPEVDWNATWRAASECGAGRMLTVGLLLGARVLRAQLPPSMVETVERDQGAARLCAQIQRWLPYGAGAPPSLLRRALYRISMGEGGIRGLNYLSRLSLSPTEEDWQAAGTHQGRSWFWDTVRRPFRLMRKYGSNN